jgi:hypothetical protein
LQKGISGLYPKGNNKRKILCALPVDNWTNCDPFRLKQTSPNTLKGLA